MLHLLHQPALFSGERSSSWKTWSTALDSCCERELQAASDASARTAAIRFMVRIPLSFRSPILCTGSGYVHRRERRPIFLRDSLQMDNAARGDSDLLRRDQAGGGA